MRTLPKVIALSLMLLHWRGGAPAFGQLRVTPPNIETRPVIYRVKPGADVQIQAEVEDEKGREITIVHQLVPGQLVFCTRVSGDWCRLRASSSNHQIHDAWLHADPSQVEEMDDVADVEVHLDLPAGQKTTTAYSKPEYDLNDCQDPAKTACVAWPTEMAKLWVFDNQLTETRDPLTGSPIWNFSYQMHGQYQPEAAHGKTKPDQPKEFKGWITDTYVASGKREAVVASQPESSPENCPECNQPPVLDQHQQLDQLHATLEAQNKQELFDALIPQFGKCIKLPTLSGSTRSNPPFNQTLGAYWQGKKELPQVIAPGGRKITASEMAAIDTLARTILSELGVECMDLGIQYPMAVAKIALNRAYSKPPLRERFLYDKAPVGPPPTDPAGRIIRALMAPYQFSTWNREDENGLRRVLCPPSDSKRAFASGHRPSQHWVDHWRTAVRIAMEAVLKPKDFSAKTSEVRNYFYTSEIDFDPRPSHERVGPSPFKRYVPSIGGKPVSNQHCLSFWEPR